MRKISEEFEALENEELQVPDVAELSRAIEEKDRLILQLKSEIKRLELKIKNLGGVE